MKKQFIFSYISFPNVDLLSLNFRMMIIERSHCQIPLWSDEIILRGLHVWQLKQQNPLFYRKICHHFYKMCNVFLKQSVITAIITVSWDITVNHYILKHVGLCSNVLMFLTACMQSKDLKHIS